MNPLAQFAAPPRGPSGPDWRTTNPGRSRLSLPRPYVAHAPMLGRPGWAEPVLKNTLSHLFGRTQIYLVRPAGVYRHPTVGDLAAAVRDQFLPRPARRRALPSRRAQQTT